MIDALLLARLTYFLGITNLVGLALVFFSCRCLVGQRFVRAMMQHTWYQKFYASHCFWWYFFFASVLFHSILAIVAYGIPL